MPYRVKVSRYSTGKKKPGVQFVIGLFTDCLLDGCLPPRSVLRVNALHAFVETWHSLRRVKFIEAIPLVGQVYAFSGVGVPDKTSGVRQPLRFGQISLASANGLFGKLAFSCE